MNFKRKARFFETLLAGCGVKCYGCLRGVKYLHTSHQEIDYGRPYHPQGFALRGGLLGRRSERRAAYLRRGHAAGRLDLRPAGRRRPADDRGRDREEGTRGSIVHQAVFLADMRHVDRCRQIMRDFYGAELPATSYIPQPPCGGKLLAVEALGVGQGRGEVEIERVSEELVIARHNGIAWVHCTKDRAAGRGSARL